MKTYEYTIVTEQVFRTEADNVDQAATHARGHAGKRGRVLSVIQVIPPLPADDEDGPPIGRPPTGPTPGTPTIKASSNTDAVSRRAA
jgi:hypothetical protein